MWQQTSLHRPAPLAGHCLCPDRDDQDEGHQAHQIGVIGTFSLHSSVLMPIDHRNLKVDTNHAVLQVQQVG